MLYFGCVLSLERVTVRSPYPESPELPILEMNYSALAGRPFADSRSEIVNEHSRVESPAQAAKTDAGGSFLLPVRNRRTRLGRDFKSIVAAAESPTRLRSDLP